MKAVIMAGGKGARLYPLTQDIPKPLMHVMGRPLIDHMVRLLALQGFEEVVVTLGHQSTRLLSHLGNAGFDDLPLYCALEEYPLGPAGSVKNAASLLEETFVVVSGDTVTDVDLNEATRFHRERGALVTMVLREVDDISQFGMAVTDSDGRIVQFREKPVRFRDMVSRKANTGLYVIEPEVLDLIPDGTYFDFAHELFPLMLARELPIYGCETHAYWGDVGTFPQYLRAHRDAMDGRVKLALDGLPEGPDSRTDASAIHPTAEIEGPVCLGPGVKVGAGAHLGPFTELGSNVEVGEGTHIEGSVLSADVVVGPGSHVCSSIIGDGTRVPEGTRLVSSARQGGVTVGFWKHWPRRPSFVAASHRPRPVNA